MLTVKMRVDAKGLSFLERVVPRRANAFARKLAEHTVEIAQSSWSPVSPSAPGDYPAVVTGTLSASLNVRQLRGGLLGRSEWAAVAEAPYAAFLEFGTIKMAPRPFMSPSAERALDALRGEMRAVYDISVR